MRLLAVGLCLQVLIFDPAAGASKARLVGSERTIPAGCHEAFRIQAQSLSCIWQRAHLTHPMTYPKLFEMRYGAWEDLTFLCGLDPIEGDERTTKVIEATEERLWKFKKILGRDAVYSVLMSYLGKSLDLPWFSYLTDRSIVIQIGVDGVPITVSDMDEGSLLPLQPEYFLTLVLREYVPYLVSRFQDELKQVSPGELEKMTDGALVLWTADENSLAVRAFYRYYFEDTLLRIFSASYGLRITNRTGLNSFRDLMNHSSGLVMEIAPDSDMGRVRRAFEQVVGAVGRSRIDRAPMSHGFAPSILRNSPLGD